jgi:hypothetical protein
MSNVRLYITHGEDGYWLHLDGDGKSGAIHIESNAFIVGGLIKEAAATSPAPPVAKGSVSREELKQWALDFVASGLCLSDYLGQKLHSIGIEVADA